ncbi:MAG: ABC transporter ATP-binding protein [Clostridia bacterium]|nr:ABC transporter ATP-binding protein [Clostridia bacterium]MBR6741200.1 ABC transporter ATP-binding protein [Clostridia bacterium]
MKRKNEKQKKEKLSFKKTLSNNFFALKAIWQGSPSYLIIYLGSSFVYGILGFLTNTYLLRKIVNEVSNGGSVDGIINYTIVLSITCLISYTALHWYWNVGSLPAVRKIGADIEKKLFVQAARVELACYETPSFYDKYVRAMDEAYNRMISVMRSLDRLINKLIALAANSLLLFVIDPWLILFGLFPLVLGVFRRLENVAKHDFEVEIKPINRRKDYVKRTFYLGEYAKEMRIGGMYASLLRDLKGTLKDFKKVLRKYGFKRMIYMYIRTTGLEIVTILGATLYAVWSTMQRGTMQVGDCIVVLSSIGTISYMLSDLMQNLAEFGEHALFLDDVRFFLDYTPKIADGETEIPENTGDLVVKNLSFKYEGCEKDILKNINFTWKKGERIALVGSNGSGKTTLVKLLLRLYDPTSGEISLNGQNIKDFKAQDYREMYSTVFQDFKVFSLNIKENVLLRITEDGDDELVTSALKESGVYDKVSTIENGLDAILTREFDDKGVNLSIGEQQKLSLARVFATDTPFVILDEPSSALDPIAEYEMFENMMRATNGRSVIFISHRLSSAVLADRVLLMENGEIAECGTHAELIKKNGKYADMFHRQAENYLGSEVEGNE